LRARYLLRAPEKDPLLAEEVLVTGVEGRGEAFLKPHEALALLAEARPVENIPEAEKRELVEYALGLIKPWVDDPEGPWARLLAARAAELEAVHRRLRRVVGEHARGLAVEPQGPPDVLGLLVLQPVVRG